MTEDKIQFLIHTWIKQQHVVFQRRGSWDQVLYKSGKEHWCIKYLCLSSPDWEECFWLLFASIVREHSRMNGGIDFVPVIAIQRKRNWKRTYKLLPRWMKNGIRLHFLLVTESGCELLKPMLPKHSVKN